VTDGWWEAPAEKSSSPWVFHPVKFSEPCSQMYVYDFDGDGGLSVKTTSNGARGGASRTDPPEPSTTTLRKYCS